MECPIILLPVITITYKKEVGAIFLDAVCVKTKNDV